MLFWVVKSLGEQGIRLPAAFSYTSTRMVLAAITSLLFSILVGPFFIRKLYELKIGQPIRMEDCPLLGRLHEKKKDTPTMGGILILSSLLLSLFLWMDLTSPYTLGFLATIAAMGLLGGYDDYLKLKHRSSDGLSAKKKFLLQSLFGVGIAFWLLYFHDASGFYERLYLPFLKDPAVQSIGVFGAFLLIVFVLTGSSNAVNLTDGLDGLAAGCLTMAAAPFALIAFLSNHSELASYLHIPYIEGSGEIAIFLSAFMGACIGFLWYNSHPAQLFMGDIGSLTLGALLGLSAIFLKREPLLAVVGGVFVAETVSVILQVGSFKLRNKKRIFLCTPLHHHFEYKGWAETKVVIRFWIIALLLALIGTASLKFQ